MTTLPENISKTVAKLPDGPKTPIILQTIQGIARPLEYLEKARSQYGDCFTMRSLGFPPIVVLSHPKAIQQVLNADPHQFTTGELNKSLEPIMGENSLIRLDGERHASQRRLITPPFHGERMRAYGKIICDITVQVMNEWTVGNVQPIHSAMQEISLRVIIRAVFGIDEGERYQKLRQLLTLWLNAFNSPLSSSLLFFGFLQQDWGAWSPWGRFLRLRQQIDQLLYAEIQERRQQNHNSGEDILSLMMSACDVDGQPMSDIELRDELMTLLFGGHETTASALAWAFYWIHQLPEVRDKLLKELETLGDQPEPTDIARLPYLNAVCSETLRIYPILLFTFVRIVKSPIEIMGDHFEPGTILAPCIYLTHHRSDLYPEPEQFKPERFLERQFAPYEYFPFGGGNRRCIGMAFAQFEMKLVLATVLSNFKLVLADTRKVLPVRRGITLTPAGGVPMIITSHQKGKQTSI